MAISEIEFTGPFSWAEASTVPQTYKQGIYAHTVPQKNHHLVYYVGQTRKSFLDCMRRHNRYYRAAKYPIFPSATFAQGSHADPFNRGVYGPNPDSLEVCKANSVRLSKQIQEMLDVMQVFFAPFETDNRTRKRIEGVIMDELESIPNSFYWKGVDRARRQPQEVQFKCWITCPVNLLGMPESVLA